MGRLILNKDGSAWAGPCLCTPAQAIAQVPAAARCRPLDRRGAGLTGPRCSPAWLCIDPRKPEMTNYQALLEQKAALDAQIADALKIEKATAVTQAHSLAAQYGLTAEDVFPAASTKSAGNAGAPKYRDPATGITWTGRGKPPNWILGKDRSAFLIS